MKTYKSILIGICLITLSGCAFSNNIELPDEYIKCEHVESSEVFKYEQENAVMFETNICSPTLRDQDGKCPTVFIINDLRGNVRHYSGLEMQNWSCVEKFSEE